MLVPRAFPIQGPPLFTHASGGASDCTTTTAHIPSIVCVWELADAPAPACSPWMGLLPPDPRHSTAATHTASGDARHRDILRRHKCSRPRNKDTGQARRDRSEAALSRESDVQQCCLQRRASARRARVASGESRKPSRQSNRKGPGGDGTPRFRFSHPGARHAFESIHWTRYRQRPRCGLEGE